jgi:hypothetical protein
MSGLRMTEARSVRHGPEVYDTLYRGIDMPDFLVGVLCSVFCVPLRLRSQSRIPSTAEAHLYSYLYLTYAGAKGYLSTLALSGQFSCMLDSILGSLDDGGCIGETMHVRALVTPAGVLNHGTAYQIG